MAAEADEAAIVQQMFGTGSDEEDDFEEEEEVKGNAKWISDDVIETDGHEFRGLANQGATCYLNALLQSLYFTPELREGIYALTPEELGDVKENREEAQKLDDLIESKKYELSDEDIARLTSLGYTTRRAKRALVKAENKFEAARVLLENNEVPSVKKILIKLRQFFSLLQSHGSDAVSTKELTDAFGWVSREVRIQHDAHELNRILIDAIERSLKGTRNESLINNIYLGQMVSRTLCLQCEYCSERKENFLDAIIQVQNLNNLHESLSSQCKSEYLVGDNRYFCDKCKAKCDAKRSVAYTKLPNVLTLALNRFVFNLYTMNREKCTSKFEFPLIFDFEPFLDEKLSSTQTHRTKEDEELLRKANDEYAQEKQRKHNIEERKKKNCVDAKMNERGPLAIEAPPVHITTGTHTQVAPLPAPAAAAPPTVWRNQIPRSRSQEDEDVQRAIAESLGQVFVSSRAPQHNTTNHITTQHHEEFVAQPPMTYECAVDILLDGSCCFGLYDAKMKQWRTAVFIQKWDDKKRLMVRFTQDQNTNINPSVPSDKFLTMKQFPVDNIIDDVTRFDVKQRDLNDMSNVPKDKIQKWIQRRANKKIKKKTNKTKPQSTANKPKPQSTADKPKPQSTADKPKPQPNKPIAEKPKPQANKPKKEDKAQPTAISKKDDKPKKAQPTADTSKAANKAQPTSDKSKAEPTANKAQSTGDKAQKEDEKEKMKAIEETKEEEEAIADWSKRTDFDDVDLVGYLCDDGEVIQGDCLRRQKGKIFVHFNTDAPHFGKKYDWISIPNERICPPPKTRPKPCIGHIGYPRQMTSYESSVIGASQWNRKGKKSQNTAANTNRWKLCQMDINPSSKHLYALTGVVIHRGTPHAGHYHAYLKDFMKEGKYQKKNAEKGKKGDALWYDFNDSCVYRIPREQVAKQYGGTSRAYDECAYMLVYRRINAEECQELSLPPDLVEFVAEEEKKEAARREAAEAKENERVLRIISSSCFAVSSDGKLTMNPFLESLLKKIIGASQESLDCEEIEDKIAKKEWPTNMSQREIEAIVSSHYALHSSFITCDARESIDTMHLLSDGMHLHGLSLPVLSGCGGISALIDASIGCNVDDRLYPFTGAEGDYPYAVAPTKIGDLPCYAQYFVWNGCDISGATLNLGSARTVDICVRYLPQSIEETITVPQSASLNEIWAQCEHESIVSPVFTLVTNSPRDWPDILSKYDAEWRDRRAFAKLLHHKMNPMKRWCDTAASDTLCGAAILCIENENCTGDTIASQQWQESTKMSTILIDDYTPHSYSIDAVPRKLSWRIPKGTSLEKFFEIARTRCEIESSVDLRAFRVFDDERYLITFPYKFQLSSHAVILEVGRYPTYNEVFLMVCLLPNIDTKFKALIVERSKSVKYLKQEILKLFALNAADYKQYVCMCEDECWRDSRTLEQCNPRHGDRIGIQIGRDLIHKSVLIMSDTRNLSKTIFTNTQKTDNIYIKQECGILSIDADATYDTLRKQIYNLMKSQLDNNGMTHENLLLSWYDHVYHIPLSFPMLNEGKLQNQKNFNSTRSIICVECKDEAIQSMPKNARFLHIHLMNDELLFWPNDHHIRIVYSEEKHDKKDKITYKNLSKFIATKYKMECDELVIGMFKINSGEWCILNDSVDDTPQGLNGKPFHITKTNRHGQIFAITTTKTDCKQWPIPPLSNKARFYYKHFNNIKNPTSINAISKDINKDYHNDRQLKITNID